MSSNGQYSSPPFGLTGDYAFTGAPGSAGIQDRPAGTGGGAVIASPVVSTPYASSQLAANMPTVPVTQGDTSGMSSDSPVNGGPLQPGPLDGYLATGAGLGSDITAGHHPSAGK